MLFKISSFSASIDFGWKSSAEPLAANPFLPHNTKHAGWYKTLSYWGKNVIIIKPLGDFDV